MAVELTSGDHARSWTRCRCSRRIEGDKPGVTASVAIVSYPEDGSSRDELLTAAEIALEQSKEERKAMRMPKRQLTPVQQLRLSGRRHTA